MMKEKWVIVVGSSRMNQNTSLLCEYIQSALESVDISTSMYQLNHENIRTCNGCETCLRTGKCAINDEWTPILEEIYKSDGVVLASPSYHNNVSAQMKAFIDRAFQIETFREFHEEYRQKQRAIVLGVCKGQQKEAMGVTVNSMIDSLKQMAFEVIDDIEYYNTIEYPVEKNILIKDIISDRIVSAIEGEGQKYSH